MSMRFKIELVVDVDVDGWTTEYGTGSAGASLAQILTDLREPAHYLTGPKWTDLATVKDAKPQVAVFNERQLAAIAEAMK